MNHNILLAALCLTLPVTILCQNQEPCSNLTALDFRVQSFSNNQIQVTWAPSNNCTHYIVCANSTFNQECSNYDSMESSKTFTVPSCVDYTLSITAAQNDTYVDSRSLTLRTVPESVQQLQVIQTYGTPSVTVSWLYMDPESYCSTNFIVTWCNTLNCYSAEVPKGTYSYSIQNNIDYCWTYNLTVVAQDKVSNQTSAPATVTNFAVDRVQELTRTNINGTSMTLTFNVAGTQLCTDPGQICWLHHPDGQTPVCFSGLKRTDTSATIVGLIPGEPYNISFNSGLTYSTIKVQPIWLAETSGVLKNSASTFSVLLIVLTSILRHMNIV